MLMLSKIRIYALILIVLPAWLLIRLDALPADKGFISTFHKFKATAFLKQDLITSVLINSVLHVFQDLDHLHIVFLVFKDIISTLPFQSQAILTIA